MRSIRPLALGAALALLGAAPAGAGTALRMDLEALVDGAGLAVEARVLSARPVTARNGLPCTEYVLRVDRTFWGEPLAVRSVRLPGGPFGDGRVMVIPGVPTLTPGQDALLFLSDEGPAGFSMPVGLSQGRFEVATDPATGRRSLARRHVDLELVDPATGRVSAAPPRVTFDYEATVARIEAAAAAKRARLEGAPAGGGR